MTERNVCSFPDIKMNQDRVSALDTAIIHGEIRLMECIADEHELNIKAAQQHLKVLGEMYREAGGK